MLYISHSRNSAVSPVFLTNRRSVWSSIRYRFAGQIGRSGNPTMFKSVCVVNIHSVSIWQKKFENLQWIGLIGKNRRTSNRRGWNPSRMLVLELIGKLQWKFTRSVESSFCTVKKRRKLFRKWGCDNKTTYRMCGVSSSCKWSHSVRRRSTTMWQTMIYCSIY